MDFDATIDLFRKVDFPNFHTHDIQTLLNHFKNSNKRVLMVMSHTSTHDFLLGLLLFRACSIPISMFTNFKSPILQHWAQSMGMLTHTNTKSNTAAIIDHLRRKDEFAFLIALARTRPNETVHSSYFYVARELQIPIIVVGFDYFLRTGVVSHKSWQPLKDETYESFQQSSEAEILQEIQKICPLKLDFQVGFKWQKYPHADLRDIQLEPPNMALLYAHVVGQYVKSNKKTQGVIMAVILGIVILFIIVWGLTHKKKVKHTQKRHGGY